MKYFDELKRSMDWLGEKDDTVFFGQAVIYEGTAITNTLKDVPLLKKFEMPVNEDMQMGITVGMALNNTFPISIFPRWNFLLLAINQLINHADKTNALSDGKYNSKMIIRTAIGSQRPLHPHYQHVGDFTDAIRHMSTALDVIRLDEPHQIFEAYKFAYERTDNRPTLIVEWGDFYNEK